MQTPERRGQEVPFRGLYIMTMSKTRLVPIRWTVIALLALALLIGVSSPGWAATDDDAATVTMTVNEILSIVDDGTDNFTLTYTDFVNTTQSNTQAVTYTVQGNNITTTATTGIIAAKLSAVVSGMNIQADVGAYTNTGTSGNILLTEDISGFQTLTTSDLNLAGKGTTSGDQGKVLNGTQVVSYRGTLTRDVQSGTTSPTLTFTLKDGN